MTSRHPKQSDKPTTTWPPLVSQPQPAPWQAPLQPAAVVQRAAQSPAALTPAEVLQLHRTIGNRAVGQLVQGHRSRHASGPAAAPGGTTVQPKLLLGPVGDRYEQEADRVAQQVVQRLDTVAQLPDGQAVQRQEEDDKELLQMQPAAIQSQPGARGMALPPDLESAIQQARGGGQPLPEAVRGHMEQALGADFSGVRLHTDAQADALTRALAAKAFTTGHDVFLRQEASSLAHRSGHALLAHELSHVVQQEGTAVSPGGSPTSHATAAVGRIQRMIGPNGDRRTVKHKTKRSPAGSPIRFRAAIHAERGSNGEIFYTLTPIDDTGGWQSTEWLKVSEKNDNYDLDETGEEVVEEEELPASSAMTTVTATSTAPTTTAGRAPLITTSTPTPAPAPTTTTPTTTTSTLPPTGQSGSMTPQNPNWGQAYSVKAIEQGMTNKGIFEISNQAHDTLVVKFTDLPISAANTFGDRVMAAVGLDNPDTVPVLRSDPAFAAAVQTIQNLIQAPRNPGDTQAAQTAEALMKEKGSDQAKGLLLMRKVGGVDFGQHLIAQSPRQKSKAKQEALAMGGDPQFQVVAFIMQSAFIKSLGKMAVADALIGNQDRLSLFGKQLDPTFNPANFRVLANGLIGTFDHDTFLFSRQFFYAKKKSDIDPQAWFDVMLQGEEFIGKVGANPSPNLGAIFTPAGQRKLYDELVIKLNSDLSNEEREKLKEQFTFTYFTDHFNQGLQEALVNLAQHATELPQQAQALGTGDYLDPEALDVKLSFLEAKAQQVAGQQPAQLPSTLAANQAAELYAKVAAGVHQLGALLAAMDFELLKLPPLPAKLTTKEEKVARGLNIKSQIGPASKAKRRRVEAQKAKPSQKFFNELDQRIATYTSLQNPDRRVQKALFHLMLHKVIQTMQAQVPQLKQFVYLLKELQAYPQGPRPTVLEQHRYNILKEAGALRKEYKTFYEATRDQLTTKKDTEQKQRLESAYNSVFESLQDITTILR